MEAPEGALLWLQNGEGFNGLLLVWVLVVFQTAPLIALIEFVEPFVDAPDHEVIRRNHDD